MRALRQPRCRALRLTCPPPRTIWSRGCSIIIIGATTTIIGATIIIIAGTTITIIAGTTIIIAAIIITTIGATTKALASPVA
ncbi:MAG: hypothetical protein K2X43_19900 [Hyphomonadaceae bacterium]|nr:hypothetical protein [Hyphomonadaceae bacterium]